MFASSPYLITLKTAVNPLKIDSLFDHPVTLFCPLIHEIAQLVP